MFVAGKISRAHLKKGAKKAMLVLPAYLESYLGLKYLGTVDRSTIWTIAAELLLHHRSMCTYVLWHLGLTIISEDPFIVWLMTATYDFPKYEHFCCGPYKARNFCGPTIPAMYKKGGKIPGGSIDLSPRTSYLQAGGTSRKHDVPGYVKYWIPKRQPTRTQNPSGKITRKLEIEMPINFVDRNHNDEGHVADPVLEKATSSCCQVIVESG